MPMRLGRALVLAVIGGIALSIGWSALWRLLWFPYWHQLDARGMHVHDIEAVYLITFGPVVAGLVYLAAALLEAWIERRRFENGQRPPRNAFRILFFAMFPAFVVFILLNSFYPRVWRFPLSEAMVALVGAGLGACWVLWRRKDELGDRVTNEDVAQNS